MYSLKAVEILAAQQFSIGRNLHAKILVRRIYNLHTNVDTGGHARSLVSTVPKPESPNPNRVGTDVRICARGGRAIPFPSAGNAAGTPEGLRPYT